MKINLRKLGEVFSGKETVHKNSANVEVVCTCNRMVKIKGL